MHTEPGYWEAVIHDDGRYEIREVDAPGRWLTTDVPVAVLP